MTVPHLKQIPLAEHDLDVGRFVFYPNIVVGEFKEGIHVTFENAAFPIQVAQMTFGSETPLVYISHRLHSYSMDPTGYRDVVALFPNFKAFVVVAKNKRRRMLAHLERFFIKKPIRVFDNLESAIEWANTYVEKSS